MTDQDSKLNQVIGKLLAYCMAHRHHKRKHEFVHGLELTLYVDTAGRRHVLLAREGLHGPSLQEARTVIAHWPEPTPAVEWVGPTQQGRRSGLVAIWMPPAPGRSEAKVQLALGEAVPPAGSTP